jgi:NADPH:quinone reductase-like Zn-dependent oxidoreductase
MKAVLIRAHGGPETLRLEEVPTPRAGPGEALVRVRAVALNNLDVWARSGPPGGRPIYPWGHLRLPAITGVDVAGIVDAVGEGVEGVRPGDRVLVNPILACGRCEWCLAGEQSMCPDYHIYGEHTPGGMAEYTVVPAANLLPLPDHVSFEEAAAVPACYTTAWRGLITVGGLRAGQDLLVVGASGGVGSAAVQIGRLAGARVLALVAGPEKARRAAALGAVPLDRLAEPAFSRAVRQAVPAGVHLAIDPVGAATWPETIRSLRPGGRMVICGASGGERPDIDIRELYQRHRQILGAPMGNHSDIRAVVGLLADGRLRPVIHAVLPLAQVAEAHRLFEARAHFGKIVLVP